MKSYLAPQRMRRWRAYHGYRFLLLVARWTAWSIGVVLAVMLFRSPEEWAAVGPWFGSVANWVVAREWALIVSAGGLGGGSQLLLGMVFLDPVALKGVDGILDDLRKGLVEDVDSALEYDHRVTLFKWVPFRIWPCKWPWNGWLVPVARSRFTHIRSTSRFKANLNEGQWEGVAGMALCSDRPVIVQGLPDVSLEAEPTAEEYRDYAKRAHISVKTVKKRRFRARSLLGIRVETAENIPWGVLVVDTRETEMDATGVHRECTRVGTVLGYLTESI